MSLSGDSEVPAIEDEAEDVAEEGGEVQHLMVAVARVAPGHA